jgi:hypothetical protein
MFREAWQIKREKRNKTLKWSQKQPTKFAHEEKGAEKQAGENKSGR